jgi:hypothetical protein
VGLSNFAATTIVGAALAFLGYYGSYSLAVLLIWFWLTVIIFEAGIKQFLND